jgi:hypothetical protein
MLISFALLASFLVLVTAFKGDSVLRIALAAGGFLGFGGLYVALLVSRKRAIAA